MSTVAIIPARGNSKRLPHKNIKLFSGKPLIYYTVNFAKAQKNIDYIVVSTDNEEIKNVVQNFGVDVIDRPEELAGDFTSTAAVITHTMEQLKQQDMQFDLIATLQATNPLRPANLFKQCYDLINNNEEADSVICVSKNERKNGTVNNGFFVPTNYSFGQRSQDLTPQFYENGLLYLTKNIFLEKSGMLCGANALAYEVDEKFPIIDIDYQIDFELGEIILQKNIHLFNHLL
ncbi:MAG: acylneuraminate cytidylyltransferase family protein [Chitinophagaceae bacterium]